jgi:acetyl-CoA carboxylase biotin carboxyl carrier protein
MSIDIDAMISQMAWARSRNLSEFSVTIGKDRITLRRDATSPRPGEAATRPNHSTTVSAPTGDPAAATDEGAVTAPLAGICYLNPESGENSYVAQGQAVEAGQTVCVIEAMKVMTSVITPRAGTVQQLFVSDGDHVEAGSPIMRIS